MSVSAGSLVELRVRGCAAGGEGIRSVTEASNGDTRPPVFGVSLAQRVCRDSIPFLCGALEGVGVT